MQIVLDILSDLGTATLHPLWVPVLAWTILVLPLWALLERTDRLHPLAEYRLTQVLLAALPVGIAAASIGEMLPAAAQPAALSGPSVVVLPAIESTPEPVAGPSASWSWMHAVGLLTVGALGAGLFRLARLLLNVVAVGRVRRVLDAAPSPSLQAEADRLADRLNVHRPVRLRTRPEADVPLTLGGLRPMILVPERLAEATEELRMTLRHELVHIRRWDDLAQLAERFVAAPFAVHPLVGRLQRRIAEARERACDATVLDNSETPAGDYARLLATFADGSGPRRLGALSLSESPSSLTDRLSAMRSSMPSLLSSRFALGTALVAVGLALTVGVVACSDSVAPSIEAPEQAAAPQSLQEVPLPTGDSPLYVVDGEVRDSTYLSSLNSEDIASVEVLKPSAATEEYGERGANGVVIITTTRGATEETTAAEQTDEEVFTVVDDQPELVGGLSALQESISYPETAKEAGVEGRVIVQFIVDQDGNVTNPKVTRGVQGVLDQAALDAVKAQEFKPGRQDGEAVKVQMSLPVTFRLPDGESSPSESAKSESNESAGEPSAGLEPSPRRFYDLKVSSVLVEGSVEVMANGKTLRKGIEYRVDHEAGTVTLTRESFLGTRADIEISYEENVQS